MFRYFRVFRVLPSLIVISFEIRLCSFNYLTHDAEPHIDTGHRWKEKVSVGGAVYDCATPEPSAANHTRLAIASDEFDSLSAPGASRRAASLVRR